MSEPYAITPEPKQDVSPANPPKQPTRDERRKAAKAANAVNAGERRSATPQDEKAAARAVDALWELNAGGAFLTQFAGYEATAEAIRLTEEGFRERAYQALLRDPELAKRITQSGAMSGKLGLALAYFMLGTAVVPIAAMEMRQKRADKLEASDSENRT